MPAFEPSRGVLPPGTRIDGRYTVHGLLGRGSQAVVYDGTHDELARPVAIKVLDMSWAGEAAAISRFLREARTASALSHSHIVDVSDLGRLQDGRPYLVMPKVPGVALSEWLFTQGRQPALRVARLLAGVASALDLIHARGFVHRDIKPDNLMFVKQSDDSETVVLLDFGIAVLTSSNAPRVTQRNVLFGTPAYMPPEMWEGSAPDARGDIYALATVAFELITGVLPFDDDNPMQLLAKKYRTSAPRLSDMRRGEFPAALEAVFRRGLMRQPEPRFATAGAFLTALQHAAEGGTVLEAAAGAQQRLTLRMDARARLPLRAGRRAQLRAVFGRTRLASQLGQRMLRRRVRAKPPATVVLVQGAGLRAGFRHGGRRLGIPLAALALVLLWPTRIDTTLVLPAPVPLAIRTEPSPDVAAHGGAPAREHTQATTAATPDGAQPGAVAARQAPVRAVSASVKPSMVATPVHVAQRTGAAAHKPDAAAAGGTQPPALITSTESTRRAAEPPAPRDHAPAKPASYDPAALQQLIAEGTTALLRGRPERAIECFQAALELNPDAAPAWRGLGIAFERNQEEAKALVAYRRYLGLATQGPQREAVRKRIRMLE
jgi:hypothetical protein